MKQFLAAFLTLFGVLCHQASAQSLPAGATKEQIAARLKIEKGQPAADLREHLCFSDLRAKGFGVIRVEKVANLLGALEDAGLRLDTAFAEPTCDYPARPPLHHVFGYVDAPYSLVQRVIVQALALHAANTGKGDDWLLRILSTRDDKGRTLYSSKEEYGRKTPGEVERLEREYRQHIATFTPTEVTLYGKSGLEFNRDYFSSFYRIQDMENFVGVTGCTQFLNDERRANWVELARRHARGQFEPRGMVQGMDLAAMQNCLKVPDMDAKVRAVAPSWIRSDRAQYLKRDVKFQLDLMKEIRDTQPSLCPSQVPAVRTIPFCSVDYGPVFAKLQRMVDNEASGYTVRELDAVR